MRLAILFCLLTIFTTFRAHVISKNEILNLNGAIERFSNKLFQFAKEEQKGNLVISPLSANVLLNLAAVGAEGTTRDQIATALFDSPLLFNEETANQYHDLINNFTGVNDVLLKLVNKIYVNNQFSVKDQFKNIARTTFNSSVEEFDFSDEKQAVNTMNSWVAEQTNNRIENLISNLDTDTIMVAINAIYFKGEWLNQFSSYVTHKATFFNNGKTEEATEVDTMLREEMFNYGRLNELNAEFVELPYKDKDVVMLIVFPQKIDGLEELEQNLQTLSLKELRQKGRSLFFEVHLPKFKIETTINMKSVFEKMGVTSMFSKTDSNFAGISDSEIYINKVMQKVNIDVNEGGTEAAAASFDELVSLMLPSTVKINRPFHFKIIKNTGDHDGIVLFAGRICNFQ